MTILIIIKCLAQHSYRLMPYRKPQTQNNNYSNKGKTSIKNYEKTMLYIFKNFPRINRVTFTDWHFLTVGICQLNGRHLSMNDLNGSLSYVKPFSYRI